MSFGPLFQVARNVFGCRTFCRLLEQSAPYEATQELIAKARDIDLYYINTSTDLASYCITYNYCNSHIYIYIIRHMLVFYCFCRLNIRYEVVTVETGVKLLLADGL